jgi:hypothetical protein
MDILRSDVIKWADLKPGDTNTVEDYAFLVFEFAKNPNATVFGELSPAVQAVLTNAPNECVQMFFGSDGWKQTNERIWNAHAYRLHPDCVLVEDQRYSQDSDEQIRNCPDCGASRNPKFPFEFLCGRAIGSVVGLSVSESYNTVSPRTDKCREMEAELVEDSRWVECGVEPMGGPDKGYFAVNGGRAIPLSEVSDRVDYVCIKVRDATDDEFYVVSWDGPYGHDITFNSVDDLVAGKNYIDGGATPLTPIAVVFEVNHAE